MCSGYFQPLPLDNRRIDLHNTLSTENQFHAAHPQIPVPNSLLSVFGIFAILASIRISRTIIQSVFNAVVVSEVRSLPETNLREE